MRRGGFFVSATPEFTLAEPEPVKAADSAKKA
jgi:hypothetical protein